MTRPIRNVLFVCSHNAGRSAIAERLLNPLANGRLQARSAGDSPAQAIHPLAARALATLGIDATAHRPRHWADFLVEDAPRFDIVVTLCDREAGEPCPDWPGQPVTVQWAMVDPASAPGSDERRLRTFLDTAYSLKRRIELLINLPVHALDRPALGRELNAIAPDMPAATDRSGKADDCASLSRSDR